MKIKESVVLAFVVWMQQGQHSLQEKKGNIVMRKGQKHAYIYHAEDDYLEINEYCKERYLIFLNQYLKGGVDFINDLKKKGIMQIKGLRAKSYLELVR